MTVKNVYFLNRQKNLKVKSQICKIFCKTQHFTHQRKKSPNYKICWIRKSRKKSWKTRQNYRRRQIRRFRQNLHLWPCKIPRLKQSWKTYSNWTQKWKFEKIIKLFLVLLKWWTFLQKLKKIVSYILIYLFNLIILFFIFLILTL